MIRMRMTTPATAKNGVDVVKSGIRLSSFICSGRGSRRNHEVGARYRDDLHLLARRNLAVGCGGHVVRGAGEADEDGSKAVRRDGDGDSAGRSDHVLEAEGVRRLGLAQ